MAERTEKSNDDEFSDPRLKEPDESGMPGEMIDTDHNMPGQQGPPPQTADDDGEKSGEDRE